MKFHEAIEYCRKTGLRAERNHIIYMRFDCIFLIFETEVGNPCNPNVNIIDLDSDWQPEEVKKPLSDNICDIDGDRVLYIQDVKEAIKEFMESTSVGIDNNCLQVMVSRSYIREKAKEIFGERLVN